MEPSPSSGSLKRAKGFTDIRHVVLCLVDGCNSDLSQCREYHRRHKVCELHSKTPKVTIGGREQRFCQQCSRFHSLMEFDDGKRSCRKRLDGHNRRRRKLQSDPVTKNPGRFLSNQQGTTLLSFNITPQLLPSAMINSSWAESNVVPYYSHDNLGSTHNSFGGGNQFKNVQGYDFSISQPSFCKPVLDQNSVSGISNGLATRVVDSDCALSLLSSATSENREISISPTLLHHDMQYCEELSQFSRGIDIKPGTYIANLQSLGLFPNGPGGPSSSGPDPTLAFKWE